MPACAVGMGTQDRGTKTMKTAGFSLIELMVTVGVIAILAMIAYPNYVSQTAKGRRTEAMGLLLQYASKMERYYTENGCYRNKGTDGICGTTDDTNTGLPSVPTGSYYTISLSSNTGLTFTLTATPIASTGQANDGTLTITNTGSKTWSKNPSNTNSWQ